MNARTTRTAALATTLLLAAPTALLAASPSSAAAPREAERSGACGDGRYELSAEHDDGGIDVSVDLDFLAPGARWKVVVRQDGQQVFSGVRRVDREGDLEVDRFLRNTSGTDTIAFRATRVGGGAACGAKVTVR